MKEGRSGAFAPPPRIEINGDVGRVNPPHDPPNAFFINAVDDDTTTKDTIEGSAPHPK